ncbi:hypothetical protein Tco_1093060 [Tanacetum coccineum]|uniref:Uncharacterized protein n=1 Tax=Tanacetum coccineum TaxID=301880 RepID=A0ABQ5IDL7_9ASTR
MEEVLYKFIDEGRREHGEIGGFIREFKRTNELLLKERNNSLRELEFEVYGLSKAINNAQLTKYKVKGVTTRGGKTTTKIIHDTNDINKEPPILHHDKPHRLIMDDPNITMEEYTRLEEEKARRQGQTFDWQTASYGKRGYYETEDDSFTDIKIEYPAIVFDDISDDNAFNGIDGGDVIDHTAKVLEILEWIKIPNVDKDQLRLHVFPISLSGHAKEWWDNEPYLDAQEGNGIYNFEESNEYSPPIPVSIKYDVDNPDEVCKSEEFKVIRYSIGTDEEFITISPSKYETWGKTYGSMSCIYHDLFNKKFRGWLVKHTK